MIPRSRSLLAVLLAFASIAAYAQCPSTGAACTATISPGANVTLAVQARSAGQTLCLNPGTYTSQSTPQYADANSFAISNGVMVCGLGATPSNVVLQGGAGDYAVKFVDYAGVNSPNNAGLANVRVTGSNGGIAVYDFIFPETRVTGVTLKDLVVEPIFPGGAAFGIFLRNADNTNIDNVSITSSQTGFNLLDATGTLIQNSTVNATSAGGALGLAVIGGSNNVIVGNTIGQPKIGPTYSFNAGGVVFYNSKTNRFDNNVVQGMRDDGLDFQALDGAPFGLVGAMASANSNDNYAGKNRVIHTGLADGQPGGSGIWANCASNGTWIYGNESSGARECGLCVWISRSNMVLGNRLNGNGIAGLVISGGQETNAFCSNPAYRLKPTSTFVQSNTSYFNHNEQYYARNADTTLIASNYASPRNGFGGPLQTNCAIPGFCQSAITFDTDATATNSNGARIVANISHDDVRGFQSDDGKTINVEFAYNRLFQPQANSFNRYVMTGTTNWDGGPATGGNYWTLFPSPNGNPGTNPYGTAGNGNAALGVYESAPGNTTGRIVDRYPYQSESLGRSPTVTVFEPRANQTIAAGTRRTVRWYGQACIMVDIYFDNATALATNIGNTGYAIVTTPSGVSTGSHSITVRCKNSAGTQIGLGTSPTFVARGPSLQILAPGRDDVFNSGTQIAVGWKKTAAVTSVNVDLSLDGGATYPHTFGPFTGTFARITLPAVNSTAYAMMRVRSATTQDYTDGVFAIRGASGAGFANVPGGRQFVMGQQERLEWASPQNSRLVTITATVGGVQKSVAADLPDRGSFDWIVPEWAAPGGLTLQASFKQTSGAAISSSSTTNGSVINPTTIQPPNPPRLSNISTRMQVLSGNDVMIGGFVIGGSGNKTVVVRARGPSLIPFGITNALPDPTLDLVRSSDQVVIATNDNWQNAANQTAITNSGFAPSSPFESAILTSLAPGAYTAIVSGMNGSTGVGIVEVFEVDGPSVPLANISTRGQVLTGNDVMIGGFVVGGTGPQTVVVRARGPSLIPFGITNALANPTLQLVRSSDQVTLATNNDWQTATNAAAITASGFAPSSNLESAILMSLPPGAYTAIVSGVANGTGVGIVEVFTTP